MTWKKKRNNYWTSGKNRYFSLSRKLRRQKKSSDEFEIMFNRLTLEEVIGLKLELASKSAGSALYGLPLLHSLKDVVKEAIIVYAVSATRTYGEAARFLGINVAQLRYFRRKYKIDELFEEKPLDKQKLDHI
tara:strand:+ start:183 stop:578 length:396 start_codon:yes stop_codon:yes gene_type:complete